MLMKWDAEGGRVQGFAGVVTEMPLRKVCARQGNLRGWRMLEWAHIDSRRTAVGHAEKRSSGALRVHRARTALLVIAAVGMLCARAEAGGSWMRGSLYTANRPTLPEQIVPSTGSGTSPAGGTLIVSAGPWQGDGNAGLSREMWCFSRGIRISLFR